VSWRAVVSKKPLREGEAFVLKDDTFVLKVYRDSVPPSLNMTTLGFAIFLARQLNKLEQSNEIDLQQDR
jgi:hypothetical protein